MSELDKVKNLMNLKPVTPEIVIPVKEKKPEPTPIEQVVQEHVILPPEAEQEMQSAHAREFQDTLDLLQEANFEQAQFYLINGNYFQAFELFSSIEEVVRLHKPQVVQKPLKNKNHSILRKAEFHSLVHIHVMRQ